jgi:RNA polymerase sigma-70 factor (ECF subfamily)
LIVHTTSATLLERVRDPANQEAWSRFVQLYTPLMFAWAERSGLQDQDASDLVQEVFLTLLRKLHGFQYDRDGSFRAWLLTVVRNKWHEIQRRRAPIPVSPDAFQLSDLPSPELADSFGEAEHRQYLVQRALELIQEDLEPSTWRAWQQYAVAGRPVAEVAHELGITPHAVYLAKARVLRRLRQEIRGFLEE